MSMQAGDVIDGRYEVVRLLGQGGLGVVYLATQRSTEQPVAIKLIQPGISSHNNHLSLLRDRFIRETRLVGKLRHPHIVRLIDAGTLPDDQLFTVFEYIQGQELAAIISDEGALAPKEAVRLLVQTLEALSAAHDQGVVHRDFKPQNIMVTSAGTRRSAVVLDFGIAGVVEEARGNDYKTLTNSGHVPGTPWYMAPEQFDGNVTPQTDIYAWGLVALECLTGAQVIQASTPFQAMIWQASREAVELPDWLRAQRLGDIIARAVAKPLDKRYLTAAQLLRDLEECPLDDLARAPHLSSDAALNTESHPSILKALHAQPERVTAERPHVADLLAVSGELPTEALAALPPQTLTPSPPKPSATTPPKPSTAPPKPSAPPQPDAGTHPRPRQLPWIAAIILGLGLLAVALSMLLRPSTPEAANPPAAPDPTNAIAATPTQPPSDPSLQAPPLPPSDPSLQAPTLPPSDPSLQAPTLPPSDPSLQAPPLPPSDPSLQAPPLPPSDPSLPTQPPSGPQPPTAHPSLDLDDINEDTLLSGEDTLLSGVVSLLYFMLQPVVTHFLPNTILPDQDPDDIDNIHEPSPQGRNYTPAFTHRQLNCSLDFDTDYDQAICQLCNALTAIPLTSSAQSGECLMIEKRIPFIVRAFESQYSDLLKNPPPSSDKTVGLHTQCATMISPLRLRIQQGCPHLVAANHLITRIDKDDTRHALSLSDAQAPRAPTSPPDLFDVISTLDDAELSDDDHLANTLLASGDRICAVIASRLGRSSRCEEDAVAFSRAVRGHEEEMTNIQATLEILDEGSYSDLMTTCQKYIDWRLRLRPDCASSPALQRAIEELSTQ
jgi:serine/threonine protein kinase